MISRVDNQKIIGVKIIENDPIVDGRGWFLKIFNEKIFNEKELRFKIRETFITSSKKGVLRGMHYQGGKTPAAKLVGCIAGSVVDVLVDLREDSVTYKNVIDVELKAGMNKSIFIPAGVAHGFYAREDSLMLYMMDECYSPENDFGVNWKSIEYKWNLEGDPIISERDKNFINLE